MTLTIYERAGGFSAVRKVVSDFYDKVLESALVSHHFEGVDMRRLIDHQTRFIAFLMGGPASYTEEHIEHLHRRLGISLAEFDEVVELLEETLEDHGFAAEDIAKVCQELRKRESIIVTAR
ncbi:MAG: group 1 truncated hemoglobin [Solirubrobacterales bacterium]